jgi:hypothetical protein
MAMRPAWVHPRGRPRIVASVIDRARKALSARGVAFDADANAITVRAADATGFDVSLRVVEPRRFVVSYEGWFETFGRAEDAYDCFEYGLSDSCRLRLTFRGATAVAWQIEKRDYGVWMPGRVVRRRLAPFWRPARIERRQNRVFRSRAPADQAEE